jgi:hypothetical protein
MNDEKLRRIQKALLPEIYVDQSMLVKEALERAFFSWDAVENLYRPFDGLLLSPSICYSCKLRFDRLDSETGLCEKCFEYLQEPQEVIEWWLVSAWLAQKLRMKGEPILENECGVWWGRCVCGQAIFMDDVITKIYEEVLGE